MKTRQLAVLLVLIACSSCVSHVQPWERDLLAEPEMQQPVEPLQSAFDEHIYFSKEGAHGGDGVGGGGCGCN
jgi:hypothetical protein